MEFINFLDPEIKAENNLEDFKMPYRLYGREDELLIKDKYLKLIDYSIGAFIRFTEQSITE